VNKSRVLIVGPSPHLEGMGLGNLIDSYDIIVRMNQGYKLMKELPNDYGSRVDMLFLNGWSSRNVTDKYLKSEYGIPAKNIYKKHRQLKSVIGKKYKVPYNTNSNLGIIAVFNLLDMGYSDISLTGYSFYQTNTKYSDKYISENPSDPDCNVQFKTKIGHDQFKNVSNLQYFIENYNITLLEDTTYYYNKFKKEKLCLHKPQS